MKNQIIDNWCEQLNLARNTKRKNVKFSFHPENMQTKRDPLVSELMNTIYGKKQAKQYFDLFPLAKTIENKNGILLELFIERKLRKASEPDTKQWFRSCDIKHCDFIHPTHFPVQIKNRSNTENAACKSVRDNKNINFWYRLNARSGLVQWEKLNEVFHTNIFSNIETENEYLEFCLKKYEPYMKTGWKKYLYESIYLNIWSLFFVGFIVCSF